MSKKKWWQIPVPDKEPNLRDKKTEYYVIDKTNNRVHRMVAEDEYDLTAPRNKKDNEDIKIKEWKKLSHKEKIDSLIVSHKIKDDPVSQKMLEIISKEESEADAFYIMMLESEETKIKQEKDKLESLKSQENKRLDDYRFLYNKLTHEEKIEFHLRRYIKKEDRDYVREMLQDEALCDERFEKSLDADRKYTNDPKT